MASQIMADLLARQNLRVVNISRGQEVEGEVIAILDNHLIVDLGIKAEGIIQKSDFSPERLASLATGDRLQAYVVYSENESGQVVLSLQKAAGRQDRVNTQKFSRFGQAQKRGQILTGRVVEANKGGLVVEVSGVRGFLPTSQMSPSLAGNVDGSIGKDIRVQVIEVDPAQNKLIFAQSVVLTDEEKDRLSKIHEGEELGGTVAATLPFGLLVELGSGLTGMVHISEISWQKVDEVGSLYKIGDEVRIKVLSMDKNSGKISLSIKQLAEDPFADLAEEIQTDDVVRGTVTAVSPNVITVTLSNGLEGIISSTKLESPDQYSVGEVASFVVDSIDEQRRRVNLVPFITSTRDLIYK